jgi:flagellar motor switch/type III secretory pathway protein FliN
MFLTTIIMAVMAADNLLQNPSFETDDGNGKPAYWDSYVMSQEGSYAKPDDVAAEGAKSVKLHNEREYLKEPFNNWSQIIVTGTAGKTLELKGAIKTDKATRAFVWLQCWKKNPLALIQVAASGPVAGTADWTRVQAKAVVPKDADFVVVRCVLKGKGTASYDDLSLTEVAAEKPAEKPKPPEPEKKPEKTAEKPPEKPQSEPKQADDDQPNTLDELKAQIKLLEEANTDLTKQIGRLKTDMTTLREQMETQKIQPPAPVAAPPLPEKPKPSVPPLVPHGMSPDDARKQQ